MKMSSSLPENAFTVFFPRSVRPYSCGKAIIVGEHAVVHGAQAVAMPIPSLQMRINFQPLHGPALQTQTLPHPLGEVLRDAFKLLGVKPFPVRVEGHSDISIGAGLGSSAALCVVILRALSASLNLVLSTEQIATLANELEKRFHGTPSGLDTAAVAHERVIAFRKEANGEKTVQPLQVQTGHCCFALVDSQVRSSTLAMVKTAAPFFAGAAGKEKLGQFEELASSVINGLQAGQVPRIADAMNRAADLLRACGVVNSLMDEIITGCIEEGALAAKPTGAGGGGCILALFESSQSAQGMERLKMRFGAQHVVSVPL